MLFASLHILAGAEGRVHGLAAAHFIEVVALDAWRAYPDPAPPTGAWRRSVPYAPALIGEGLRATYEMVAPDRRRWSRAEKIWPIPRTTMVQAGADRRGGSGGLPGRPPVSQELSPEEHGCPL